MWQNTIKTDILLLQIGEQKIHWNYAKQLRLECRYSVYLNTRLLALYVPLCLECCSYNLKKTCKIFAAYMLYSTFRILYDLEY